LGSKRRKPTRRFPIGEFDVFLRECRIGSPIYHIPAGCCGTYARPRRLSTVLGPALTLNMQWRKPWLRRKYWFWTKRAVALARRGFSRTERRLFGFPLGRL
jgi:hypothetical protein